MEREQSLLISLIEYLTAHGYPKEALVFEWKIDGKHMVDLAVIEPTTSRPIALFELKRRKNLQNLSMATRQLAAYKKALGDDQVPTYVVFPAEGIPPFEMYHLKDGASEINKQFDTQIERVPDYSVMKNSAISRGILKTEKQQRSTLDWFQVMCYLLAVAVVALVVLDFLGIVKITPERLTLIGIIIALVIVPMASKLKILGMEFERRKKEEKPD